MNFSRILHDSSAAKRALSKLNTTAQNLKMAYANLTEPSEEIITGNFFGISRCNKALSDVKTLSFIIKDQKTLSEVEDNLNQVLNMIKSNLNSIAIELEPADYETDLRNIIQILNDRNIPILNQQHFIFPKGEQIIIGTTMDCGEKKVVFTTVYTDTNFEKFLNLLDDQVNLENYNFGIPLLNNNITKTLDSLIDTNSNRRIDSLIKNSTVFDNFIKSSVNDRVDISKTFQILTNYFSDKLEKSYLYESDLLFKFKSNLTDREIKSISNILKLSNNDRYKFMALLKE